MKRMFLCDKDIAAILGVSQSTVTRAAQGINKRRNVLQKIHPIYVGGARRWNLSLVANALGVSVEEIESRLM